MRRSPRHHGSPWTASDNLKLTRLRAAGASGEEIAAALGRSRAAIYQHLATRHQRKRTPR